MRCRSSGSRCEEIGQDPATLRLSVNIDRSRFAPTGQARVDLLGSYRDLGLHRVQGLLQASTTSDEPLDLLAEDARGAGLSLHPAR